MHSSLYKISWSVKNSLNARPFKDKNSFFTVQIIWGLKQRVWEESSEVYWIFKVNVLSKPETENHVQ